MKIDGRIRFQTIIGFGGAFTDAAGININSLSESTQANLLQSYFGNIGNSNVSFMFEIFIDIIKNIPVNKFLRYSEKFAYYFYCIETNIDFEEYNIRLAECRLQVPISQLVHIHMMTHRMILLLVISHWLKKISSLKYVL